MGKRGPVKGTIVSPATLWKPGQSGNPSGRSSAAQRLEVELDTFLAEEAEFEIEGVDAKGKLVKVKVTKSRYRVLQETLFDVATDKDNPQVAAIKELYDRRFGKAQQIVRIGGLNGDAVKIDSTKAKLNAALARAVAARAVGKDAAKPQPAKRSRGRRAPA